MRDVARPGRRRSSSVEVALFHVRRVVEHCKENVKQDASHLGKANLPSSSGIHERPRKGSQLPATLEWPSFPGNNEFAVFERFVPNNHDKLWWRKQVSSIFARQTRPIRMSGQRKIFPGMFMNPTTGTMF
ncbi:hypothetical protein Y032_0348g3181 [Ancylostoma ceylanicum]|uniref:Uncharacterized protein n=1 Tax=Ancylostoma ceylanicum TaxID=53326 RepID=A0A016RXS1_9BILA|nr:hypothetical protein Y032_0348g3181 [Ancylostoma ceylanicum]